MTTASSFELDDSRKVDPCTIRWGPIQVDLVGGFARLYGEVVDLQPLQLRILGLLVAHAGRIVTREELRRKVFRASQARHSTSVARQICLLRARLGAAKDLLVTVRGGYGIGVTLVAALVSIGAP
jgi:DNA-binding response OmpR family regulator